MYVCSFVSSLPRGTRVLDRPTGAHLAFPRAKLVAAGAAPIALGPQAITIGSDDHCTVVLADAAVSKLHCELCPTPVGLLLRDLDSTNGTIVDGRRIREVYLDRDTKFRVGETTLELTVEDGEESVEISRATSFGGLVGHSPVMQVVFGLLERAAKSEATVLITGESGTGKELAARALHDKSPRRDGAFVVFDCGAASPTLLEAQLFGHAKGAFTGAGDAREGVFEAADGGTLVLDELGELPLELQPKLLRALESRTVCRLGETKPRAIDVRFVASTHRNLEHEAKAGRFREDLYYRVGVLTIRMQSLRERREEVPRLFRHFLAKVAGDDPPSIPNQMLEVLKGHSWPGNVRELRNFAERFFVLRDLVPVPTDDGARAAPQAQTVDEFHEAKRQHLESFERGYFEELFRRFGSNVSEAARVAGLSRQTCYRMMHKHGLKVD